MSYSPQQKIKIEALIDGCVDYTLKMIDYQTNNYPNAHALSRDPEGMDNIINLNRALDAARVYLNEDLMSTGVVINEHLYDKSSPEIDTFLNKNDPISIIQFFNSGIAVKNYILSNELKLGNSYQNDQAYLSDYQQFV